MPWYRSTNALLTAYAILLAALGAGFLTDDTIWLGKVWAACLLAAAIANIAVLTGRDRWIEPAGTLAVVALAARPVGAIVQAITGGWDRSWPRLIIVVSLWILMTIATAWIYQHVAEVQGTGTEA